MDAIADNVHTRHRRAPGAQESDADPRRMLVTGSFLESWPNDCRNVIQLLSEQQDLNPIVVLPDDILVEDYAPYFDVVHGDNAERFLQLATELDRLFEPALICIDLAPRSELCPTPFLQLLNDCLHDAWPKRSRLVVFAPSPARLLATAFDLQIDLTKPGDFDSQYK